MEQGGFPARSFPAGLSLTHFVLHIGALDTIYATEPSNNIFFRTKSLFSFTGQEHLITALTRRHSQSDDHQKGGTTYPCHAEAQNDVTWRERGTRLALEKRRAGLHKQRLSARGGGGA